MYGQTATSSSMQVFKLLMNLVDTFQPNILFWLIWEWFQVFWMEIWFNSWYCQRVLIAFHTCSSSLPRPRATPPQARCLASPPLQWRWPLHWRTELLHVHCMASNGFDAIRSPRFGHWKNATYLAWQAVDASWARSHSGFPSTWLKVTATTSTSSKFIETKWSGWEY